jgi:hypothetical protein
MPLDRRLSDVWFCHCSPGKERQEVTKHPAFHPHFETERSPQFEVALQMIFEISTGHA